MCLAELAAGVLWSPTPAGVVDSKPCPPPLTGRWGGGREGRGGGREEGGRVEEEGGGREGGREGRREGGSGRREGGGREGRGGGREEGGRVGESVGEEGGRVGESVGEEGGRVGESVGEEGGRVGESVGEGGREGWGECGGCMTQCVCFGAGVAIRRCLRGGIWAGEETANLSCMSAEGQEILAQVS